MQLQKPDNDRWLNVVLVLLLIVGMSEVASAVGLAIAGAFGA